MSRCTKERRGGGGKKKKKREISSGRTKVGEARRCFRGTFQILSLIKFSFRALADVITAQGGEKGKGIGVKAKLVRQELHGKNRRSACILRLVIHPIPRCK